MSLVSLTSGKVSELNLGSPMAGLFLLPGQRDPEPLPSIDPFIRGASQVGPHGHLLPTLLHHREVSPCRAPCGASSWDGIGNGMMGMSWK